MNERKKSLFLNLIKNGLGFSGACAKMGFCPKEWTHIYLTDEDWRKDIDEAFDLGLTEILINLEKHKGEEAYERWEKLLYKYPSKPALWGSGLNEFQIQALEQEGVIPIGVSMIKTALSSYGNLRDVATALCLEYEELIQVINREFELKHLAHGI